MEYLLNGQQETKIKHLSGLRTKRQTICNVLKQILGKNWVPLGLGENGKRGISQKLEIVGEKEKHIIKEKNTTDKVTMTENEKTSFENSKIVKLKTRLKLNLSLISF